MAEGAILLFVVWGLATPLALIPGLTKFFRTLDFAGLIPDWRFFAPRPGRSDIFLLYRGITSNSEVTPWREITASFDRRCYNAIWNPGRRERKALIDIVSELGVQCRQQSDSSIQASVPYIALLRLVSSEATLIADCVKTQFLILSRDGLVGESEMQPAVLSAVHDL